MKLRGNALGIGIGVSMAMVAFVAGCGSSNNAGTGGKTGAGGAGAGGADAGAATGGKGMGGSMATGGSGMGGSTATDGGADAPADAPGDAATDRAPDAVADAGPPVCGPFADGGTPNEVGIADAGVSSTASFFVASNTAASADLGGLLAADARCDALARSVGLGRTWHAYLSVERAPPGDGGGQPINARDRIGSGPWYNVRGVMVAANLTELHARHGDPTVFLDEHGLMINGQWTGSGTPNEHDILTGTNVDGTVAIGKTCSDWTSGATVPDGGVPDGGAPDGGSYFVARIGHTDGFGGRCSTTPAPPNDVTSWNSAHDTASCADIRSRGGVGHIYCFAVN